LYLSDLQAVNGLLAGLPVRLSQGTIGSIIARVPWPNPLTSTLGLSVSSLHLVLEVTDVAENVPPTSMAESLASLSESFVHDDLDHEEEAQLRHSVHHHARTTHEQHLPGGFEDSASPEVAVLEPEVDETTLFSALVERLVARFVLDLQDLRIVLVKPDLTELIFAVAEIRYGDSSTEVSESLSAGSPLSHGSGAVRDDRTVTVAGVTLSIKSLQTPSASVDHTPTPARTPSQEPATSLDAHSEGREVDSPGSIRVLSPILSDSDLDDEATMALSQSLFFPPRSASPAGSVASSMYQSAISEGSPKNASVAMRDIDDEPFLNPDHHSEDNRSSATQPEIISMPLAHPIVLREPNSIVPVAPPAESTHSQPNVHSIIFSMSDPLTITVSKPARRQTNTEHETKAPGDLSVSGRRAMSVSVSVGVLAIALRAHHIRDILALSQAFARDSPQDVSASPSPSTSRPVFEVVTSIRGLVVVLLPHDLARRHGWNDTLKSYYNQPLVPPPISPAYSRLFVDGVQSSICIQTSPHATEKGVFETTTSIGLDVTDISLFSFHNMDSSTSYALPVLITDPLLHQQYSQNHHQPPLPRSDTTVEPRNMSSFEVVDWTDSTRRVETAKVSSWRVRPSASLHQRSGVGITTLGLSTSPPVDGYAEIDTLSHLRGGFTRKAISMNVVNQVSTRKSNITSSSHITASSTPLHIFADLGSLESSDASYDSRLLVFVDECLPTRPAMEASTASSILNVDEDRSPRALYTPRARATELPMTPHTEMTRQHIVNELGLEFDYVNEGHTNSYSRVRRIIFSQSWMYTE
jgi:autophagy-related protein 2